jgi:hypothetical protein
VDHVNGTAGHGRHDLAAEFGQFSKHRSQGTGTPDDDARFVSPKATTVKWMHARCPGLGIEQDAGTARHQLRGLVPG